MGEVFAAHDPELNRVVAIKLIGRSRAGESPEARARFHREAQAMARLNHPNVVSVFDVGLLGRTLFVTMELVEGPTLREWLAQKPRRWQEIVEVFLQAGRGLEAAHAAGIVHRDFKPANVIVGDRVRVVDFGLARLADDSTPSPVSQNTPLDGVITTLGTAVGTPAYMAPEQRQGDPPSPLADQFSFTLALAEALGNDRSGALPRGVPRWLRRAVARGLSERPSDRHPSMRPLLAALAHGPVQTRRRWLAAGAAVVIGAAAIVLPRATGSSACEGSEARLAGIWDPVRKREVHEAFRATGFDYSEDAWQRVSARLDGYAGEWVARHRETCRATRVEGRQSEALMDRRMSCLERRRAVLKELTGLWIRGVDDTALASASDAVTRLPALAGCDDPGDRPAAPTDRVRSALLVGAQDQLAAARALALIGRYQDAEQTARVSRVLADASGWVVLQAEASFEVADAVAQTGAATAEAPLLEAARLGEIAHDDLLVTRAMVRLVRLLAYGQQSAARALLVADLADGALARSGDDPALRLQLLRGRGAALLTAGDLQGARALFTLAGSLALQSFGTPHVETLAARSELAALAWELGDDDLAVRLGELDIADAVVLFGPGHPRVGEAMMDMCIAMSHKHLLDRAHDCYQRALERIVLGSGPQSNRAAVVMNNMGTLEIARGNLEEARRLYEATLAIRERLLGPEHPLVGISLLNLSNVYRGLGRTDEAIALAERVLALYTKVHGPEHRAVAHPHELLAAAYLAKRDRLRALEHMQKALEIRIKALGDEHYQTLQARANVAEILAHLGRCAEVRPLIEQVVRVREATKHSGLGGALAIQADCDLQDGKLAPALEGYQRAIALYEAQEGRVTEVSVFRFHLGQTLWKLGRRKEAIAAAERARDEMGSTADLAEDREELASWLASRKQ